MLPRTVKIGAHNYKIKSVPPSKIEGLWGEIDKEKTTIEIAKGMSVSRKIEVILHECVHAMLSDRVDDETEEEIAGILGEILAQFLGDNPYFVIEAVRRLADRKNFDAAVDNARRRT